MNGIAMNTFTIDAVGFPEYWPFRKALAGAPSTGRRRELVANKFGSPSRIRIYVLLVNAAIQIENGRRHPSRFLVYC
jgi:hypothetical protein